MHATLWGLWLLGLFTYAPRYESMYHKVNLKLPTMSELVLSLTHGWIPAALLLVLIFVAVDSAVSYRLRGVLAKELWSGFMTVAPVVVILLTCVAVCLPSVKVVEALVN
ncbi:MAG TPA: hypothetical protein VMG10_01810 [Gemmataceae bacterium]|nr:hypothetical protein [Gemmataceae bacterium]